MKRWEHMRHFRVLSKIFRKHLTLCFPRPKSSEDIFFTVPYESAIKCDTKYITDNGCCDKWAVDSCNAADDPSVSQSSRFSQSQRRPLIGPPPSWKHQLVLFKTLLRHYANQHARPLWLPKYPTVFNSSCWLSVQHLAALKIDFWMKRVTFDYFQHNCRTLGKLF